jgi:hypothetical protein
LAVRGLGGCAKRRAWWWGGRGGRGHQQQHQAEEDHQFQQKWEDLGRQRLEAIKRKESRRDDLPLYRPPTRYWLPQEHLPAAPIIIGIFSLFSCWPQAWASGQQAGSATVSHFSHLCTPVTGGGEQGQVHGEAA